MAVTIEEIFENEPVKSANACKDAGNVEFKRGNYPAAIQHYSQGLDLVSEDDISDTKSILLTNRANSNFKLSKFEDCIADCTLSIESNPTYSKAFYRRALAYEQLEEFDKAIEDMEKLFTVSPEMKKTEWRKLEALKSERDKQFEEKKNEMMKNLKDIGNSILGQFGLSTDDFNIQKDPVTGSYSLSMGGTNGRANTGS